MNLKNYILICSTLAVLLYVLSQVCIGALQDEEYKQALANDEVVKVEMFATVDNKLIALDDTSHVEEVSQEYPIEEGRIYTVSFKNDYIVGIEQYAHEKREVQSYSKRWILKGKNRNIYKII